MKIKDKDKFFKKAKTPSTILRKHYIDLNIIDVNNFVSFSRFMFKVQIQGNDAL